MNGMSTTHFVFSEHNQRIFNIILKYVPITSMDYVLDAGCGTGNLTALIASNSDAKVIGTDIRKNPFYHPSHGYFNSPISKNPLLVVADSFRPPFKDNLFKLVVNVEVLDHVCDVDGFLKKLSRLVSQEGFICIVVPNRRQLIEHHKKEITQLPFFGFYPARLQDWLLKRGVSKGSWLHHLFSKKEIESYVSKDFCIVHSAYMPYAFENIKSKSRLIYIFIKGIYSIIFKLFPFLGSTIIVIGKKK